MSSLERRVLLDILKTNLFRLRMESRLMQKELAEKISVSQSTIAWTEAGINNPSLYLVFQLAQFYQVSMDSLLRRRAEPFELVLKKNLMRRTLPGGATVEEVRADDRCVH